MLCQQPLNEQASKRLSSFEAFVRDESKRREQEAADAYGEKLKEVSSPNISMKDLTVITSLIRDISAKSSSRSPFVGRGCTPFGECAPFCELTPSKPCRIFRP